MKYRKVILITGCSSGFGFLTAKLLAENNYQVYAGVRKAKDLTKFGHTPPLPKTVLLDVTWSQEKIDQVVKSITKKENHLDVLINNAGFGFLGSVKTFTDQEIKEQFETNVFGLLKVTRSVIPYMEKQKSGTVINISSSAGLITTAYYGIYSASKFAVEALTSALRAEESLYGIDVVSVNPGSFQTSFWKNEKFPHKEGEAPRSQGSKLNRKIKNLINNTAARRGNPTVVARKIKEIIETESPKRNYLVGYDAILLYLVSRFFPQPCLDWLIKKVVKRLA